MSLTPGTRLGPYDIQAAIGAGGMGEVYRARDTRLDRTVAIKTLPESLAADPQFRARFEQEARAIAALNHPHICTIHDVGQDQGTDYLVMEYLEGQTLADRLAGAGRPEGRPLHVEEALQIAIQMADALDKAHRAGIVHRDLKPGNIFLVRRGGPSGPPDAKLLDFGLAKTGAPAVAGSATMMPTTPAGLTVQGTILGTFQYMAPEQLEGQEADARTDIFAFGAVLYEMLAGRKAFEGRSHASLIGSILKDTPPPLSTLQPLAPPLLDHIVQRCLAKDPDERWQSAADLRIELVWVTHAAPAPASTAVARRSPRLWQSVSAALLVALLGALAVSALRTRETSIAASPVVFEVMPPDGATLITPLAANGNPRFALSSDGDTLAFVAVSADGRQQLWIRPLAVTTARVLAGTDGADAPFWSADGRYIGFFAQGKVKYVDAGGGTPQTLGDAPRGYGAAWNLENTIVFASMSPNEGLNAVRLGSTDSPVAVTRGDPKNAHAHVWPQFLPDGRHFLYAALNIAQTASDIFVGSLDGGEPQFLLTADAAARYAAPGYLLFPRGGALLAQRFDTEGLRLVGEPVQLLDTVGRNLPTGYMALSLSASGHLAYGQSSVAPARVVWRDRSGRALEPPGPADMSSLSLSRDGAMLAVSRTLPQAGTNVWLSNVTRPTPIRFTFDAAASSSPIWSPDGRFLAYRSSRGGQLDQLYRKAADGSSQEELIEEQTGSIPTDWSADGKLIIFHNASSTSWDVLALSVSEGTSNTVLNTPFNEVQGALSPDGRWLAYASDESGRFDVFVQPFPPTGAKWLVSSEGGVEPRWRRDGRELFYLSPARRLTAVPTQTTQRFESGTPETLFDAGVRDFTLPFVRRYDVTANGQRFVVAEQPPRRLPPITVIVNWTGVLQDLP